MAVACAVLVSVCLRLDNVHLRPEGEGIHATRPRAMHLHIERTMLKQLVTVILTASLFVIGVACDKQEGSKPAPAESFKTFAASFHSAAQEKLSQTWDGEITGDTSMRMMLVVFAKYEIDVKKTDSLISPYTGIIQFNAQQADESKKSLGGLWWRFPVTATFAYQDEKWVLKSAIVTDNGFCVGSGVFFTSDLMQPTDSATVKAVRERLRAASEQAGGK